MLKVNSKQRGYAGGCDSFVYECSYPAAIPFDQTHVISIVLFQWSHTSKDSTGW